MGCQPATWGCVTVAADRLGTLTGSFGRRVCTVNRVMIVTIMVSCLAAVGCTSTSQPDYWAEIRQQVIDPCAAVAALKGEYAGDVSEGTALLLALERNEYLFQHIVRKLGRQVTGLSSVDRQAIYELSLQDCIQRSR